ncbi:MAG: hypothetical protein IJM76_05910 [Lachnospiraceae bacterium]|nr:hypothetical protein [Lachnospiraceae bacterium]
MDKKTYVNKLLSQLILVCERLIGLVPDSELMQEMYTDELVHAQKLVIEITREAVGTEEPTENNDEAFMPGELEDELNKEGVSEE